MIGLALSLVLAATAQEPLTEQCDLGGNTLQINACAMADLEAETARMELYLEAARAQAQARARDAETGEAHGRQLRYLDAAQAAWESYADAVCEGVYDQWREGTIRTVMAIGCRIDLTRQRTQVIWRNHLTHVDSTPPLLPEPVGPPRDGTEVER